MEKVTQVSVIALGPGENVTVTLSNEEDTVFATMIMTEDEAKRFKLGREFKITVTAYRGD